MLSELVCKFSIASKIFFVFSTSFKFSLEFNDDFIFSKEDDNLAVNFRDQNGLSRLNIYKAEDGKAVDTKFNEIFKPEIYNIKAQYFDDDKVIFDVFKSDSTTDETTGKYSLDLKSNEMIKL